MTDNPPDPNVAALTLDPETLEPPESRAGSAAAIRSRVGEMRAADRTRSNKRAVMSAVYNGDPPFSSAKLRKKNQGDRTNVNWREAEGMADAAKTPYYSLIFRQPRFATVRTDYGGNLPLRSRWSETISEGFHQMLDQWNGHDFNVQLEHFQMCFFGVGYAMFEDARSPFWRSMKIGDVLVPDETEADIEQLDEAVVLRRLSPVKLYRMVKKEAAAKSRGWFPDRAKRAIIKAAPDSMTKQWGQQWSEHFEASLRRGDIQWNTKASRIPVADYYVKEFNEKITHCILLDDGGVADPDELQDDDSGLLFKKKDRFDSFSQAINPSFFDIGTGEWHSIKGLGPKIRDFCETSNRLTCALVDGARRETMLPLQATDGNAMQQTQLVEMAGAFVIAPNFSVIQRGFTNQLQGPLAVKGDLQRILQSNTGQYRERASNEDQEHTLGQAQLNARNQAMLSESAVDRYMKTLDRRYSEQFRRASKLGRELYEQKRYRESLPGEKYPSLDEGERLSLWFVQFCVERGVPVEALEPDYICSVKATRGFGSGSPVMVDMATRGLMEMYPLMDERAKRTAARMRGAYLIGQGNVDQIFPPFDEEEIPGESSQNATIENNFLRMPNGETEVSFEDDHLIHFDRHTQSMVQHVQQLKAGQADPMEVLIHLHGYGPHTAGHLKFLRSDPTRKGQLAQREEIWQQLSKFADQLGQQLEEAAQSQQKMEPKMDPALIAAMAKVEGELAIKRAKAQGDFQLKADKQAFTKRLKDLEAASSIQRQNFLAESQAATAARTAETAALAPAA